MHQDLAQSIYYKNIKWNIQLFERLTFHASLRSDYSFRAIDLEPVSPPAINKLERQFTLSPNGYYSYHI